MNTWYERRPCQFVMASKRNVNIRISISKWQQRANEWNASWGHPDFVEGGVEYTRVWCTLCRLRDWLWVLVFSFVVLKVYRIIKFLCSNILISHGWDDQVYDLKWKVIDIFCISEAQNIKYTSYIFWITGWNKLFKFPLRFYCIYGLIEMFEVQTIHKMLVRNSIISESN